MKNCKVNIAIAGKVTYGRSHDESEAHLAYI